MQTLLVVLPGAPGRLPVLKRLQQTSNICVLVPSSDLQRSGWAKSVVGDGSWIEWTGTTKDIDNAINSVKAWLSEPGYARRIDGVMTYDDFGTELCSSLCEHFRLTGTPVSTTRMLRDKVEFRKHCAKLGLPAARHWTIISDEDVQALLDDDQVCWPAVLKPVKGGGSWHVRKICSAAELQQTWDELSRGMRQGSFPLEIKTAGFTLEEYFSGHEVDVDGWARDGKVEFCVVSTNRPALEPYFLELGGIYPSQLPAEAITVLKELTTKVVSAFPGIHTCFHFEAKINEQTLEVMPIEFNARPGGAECPASVEAVTGYYLPAVAAFLALDRPVPKGRKQYEVVASTNLHKFESGVLMECSDEHVDATLTKLVTSVLHTGGVGKPHVPNNGSMSCLGWLATGGDTVEEAEQNLQMAISQTRITVM